MPEGDTLHLTARGLSRALLGRTVTGFETVYAHLAVVDVDRPLAGRTIDAIRAVGKHLLVTFSGGLTLRTHLRMNGSWHIYRPGERWQRPFHAMRITIKTEAFVAVGFDVPDAELLDDDELARHEVLGALGPDLLADDFDPAEALRRLRAEPDAELGEALLNQRVMSGLGNVYKSEICFTCKLNPFTRVGALDEETLVHVIAASRRAIKANVLDESAGVPATYRGMRRTTGRMNPAERLWVYGRGGAPCRRCGEAIAFARQGQHARVTYSCPRCQPKQG